VAAVFCGGSGLCGGLVSSATTQQQSSGEAVVVA